MVDAWNLTILKPLVPSLGAATITNPAYLLSAQPGEKATFGAGTKTAIFDLGASVPLRQLALLYTTFAAGDTVRITASDNPDGVTAAVLDTGAMSLDAQALEEPSGYRHFFYHRTAGSKTARYVKLSATVTGTKYAGRLVVGDPFQPENNAAYGETNWGFEEADDPELLDSGVEVLYELSAARVFQFTLDWLSEKEVEEEVAPLGRLQHEGVPLLVVRRPDEFSYRHNGLFYGILRMKPPVPVDYDTFEVACTIRSML